MIYSAILLHVLRVRSTTERISYRCCTRGYSYSSWTRAFNFLLPSYADSGNRRSAGQRDNMSDTIPLPPVAILLVELIEVDDWYMLGAYLNVPVFQLKKIKATYTQDGVERCKLEMMQYWLDTTMTASWKDIAGALEQLNMLKLAARLKLKYLRTSPATTPDESVKSEMGVPALPQQAIDETEPSVDDAVLDANVKVISELQGLESDFSNMMTDTRKDLKKCDIAELQFFLDDLFGVDEFRNCHTIDEVLRKLRRDHIDTFNIRYLEQLISRFHQTEEIVKKVEEYEEKKEEFLRATTVKEFQQAVVSKAETVIPKGMAAVTIKIPKEYGIPRTMKDVEELAKKGFKGRHKNFVKINVKPGSIIITWYVPEALYGEIVRLARENTAVLREEGVEEVSIVGKKSVTLSTEDGQEVNLDINEQVIAELRTKLRVTEERLQATNRELIEQRDELEQRRRMVADLETNLTSISSSQVQVTGEGKHVATAGKETSFELSLPSSATPSITFPIKQLCCQLTDLHNQHIHCNITSAHPGVCTVKYTPTLPGPHQLRITIRETDIPGSPFTVHVLPSPKTRATAEQKGVVLHTITGVDRPRRIAVSTSGEVVVSEHFRSCISVYRKREKILSFGSQGSSLEQFQHPHGVAITPDNHILVADESNHRIQMWTLNGKFVASVGEKGHFPLQFYFPSGIAVHSSGRVFVADSYNHRIQVLHADLSFSHTFGSEGGAPGQFKNPNSVACDSNGVVYVTDFFNHRVQLLSTNGEFISSFGSEGSQHGQLYLPTSIAIDSTNTMYITDRNHRVSVYTCRGQFIKCFGAQGSGEGEFRTPTGVAVDNTTGAVYVCDYWNNRVVMY